MGAASKRPALARAASRGPAKLGERGIFVPRFWRKRSLTRAIVTSSVLADRLGDGPFPESARLPKAEAAGLPWDRGDAASCPGRPAAAEQPKRAPQGAESRCRWTLDLGQE